MNDEMFEKGLKIRKEVLGAEYVEKSLANADDFTSPMQRLVNIAMLAVLNRPNEFKLHIRGALSNGVTKEEIREILLQVAIYAGVPAAIDSFKNAKEILEKESA